MSFSAAQVFYLDPAAVTQAPSVSIDRIDLYFKSKPQATNNKSGINNPGVQVFLTTTANTVPALPTTGLSTLRSSRVNYNDVQVSASATLPTTFRFDPPVPFVTGQSVAMLIQYDGDEDFVPWTDVTGDVLIGTTNTVSTGTSKNSAIGPYYSYISGVPSGGGTNSSNSNMLSIGTPSSNAILANASYTASSWTPKSGTALKFNVFVARYTVNGNNQLSSFTNPLLPSAAQIKSSITTTTTANGETQFTVPQERIEYFFYDRTNSTIANISAGERVFPILPEYPPGAATKAKMICSVDSTSVYCFDVNFSTIFPTTSTQTFIVIRSANHLGANADIVNVRQVTAILSNNQIQIDQPLTFTNAAATFWVAPVATVDQFKTARFFGNNQDMVICRKSNANSTVSFNPMQINSVSISANGTGYSNNDYVVVTGHSYIANKYLHAWNANANIVTNSNGSITQVLLNNVGSGFWNVANLSYVIANTTGSNSTGTGATLTFTVGTNIKGEFLGFDGKGGNFANVTPRSIDIGRVLPAILVSTPAGTMYNTQIRFPYYSVDDSSSPTGRVVYCDADNNWDSLNIQTFAVHNPFEFAKRRCLPSWSGELFIPYANGAVSNGAGGSTTTISYEGLTSNSSVLTFTMVSNNDFTSPVVVPSGSKITFSRYIINNDYTNENTNYGNAWAKGIETRMVLASNTLAEDLLVYATVYQPANTSVLCFAKVYNTHDNDSFDTKAWTMLEARSANNLVSSPTNLGDVFEVTWGFQKYPNVAFQCTGTATTTNGSKTITGANTNFSNLVSGDLVLIQNGLFQNSYMVAVVNVVTNSTSMTINKPVANLNLVGSGFTVSKLAYKYQAFNNYLNDNVVRYYSSTMTENDGFNAVAIKLVMLSANGLIVPLINDVRAVAVSA